MIEEQDRPVNGFEQALEKIEREADAALGSAERLVKGLKGLKQAAQLGDVRGIQGGLGSLGQVASAAAQNVDNLADSWTFDAEAYLRDGGYTRELLAQARAAGLSISEQDGRLFAFPVLVSLDPGRAAVSVDRKAVRGIRPSALLRVLTQQQKRPPRFKPEAFLASLYAGYVASIKGEWKRDVPGPVIRLLDIYTLFTLLPGGKKDYSQIEFARDVYLLDTTPDLLTADGFRLGFEASTGTKGRAGVLSIVTEGGSERRYYGVSFAKAERE